MAVTEKAAVTIIAPVTTVSTLLDEGKYLSLLSHNLPLLKCKPSQFIIIIETCATSQKYVR